MAATRSVTWFLIIVIIKNSSGQTLGTKPFQSYGICKSMFCNSLPTLHRLKDCVVVLGNLHILLLERTNRSSFQNISFPNLREVTGYMVVYRVRGLESLGQLFPNLARIRGTQLLDSFGLIVYDMPSLREVGLYSLLKIDRGGVTIWGGPQMCFVDTVDWKTIAPRSRHVLSPTERHHCNMHCTCSTNPSANHCWNIRKCQRFLVGSEGERCNKQCLGCRKTNPDDCSVCRHYTYRGTCIPQCPDGTVILPANHYCLTAEECKKLDGWSWNNTCVFDCPIGYVKTTSSGNITCESCVNCHKTCGNLFIQTLDAIQMAERCVYINGSLVIHVRAIPEAMDELRTYLKRIEVVSQYIVIYGSITITSLDFLSSLRRIGGESLKNGKYSFVLYDMLNLQTLFTPNVTQNLEVNKGTLKIYGNPMLCMSEIDKLKDVFKVKPNEIDIPQGSNGYSGGCAEVSVGLQVRVVNETSAIVMFSPIDDPDVYYSLLYVRIPLGVHTAIVPETCCDSEWYAVNVPTTFGHFGFIELTSLRPASNYAVCIETYDPSHRHLARSTIINFTTPVGKPEPPFILELVASSSEVVVLRWVDHKDYRSYISRYELDVTLIDIYTRDVLARDHCKDVEDEIQEIDYTRHAVVKRPPSDYDRGCESMCGVLSTVTVGAMVEENFDVCRSIDFGCDNHEADPPDNSTLGGYVRTIVLNISSPRNDFQVGGLAPFRDYRFRLRACTSSNCSRSTRGVVRTLPSKNADIPSIIYISADKNGYITVKWKPPEVTNGPILAYTVQVLPVIKLSELGSLLPQTWCVLANTSSLIVHSEVTKKYGVRVCSATLASSSTCSEWKKVVVEEKFEPTWWWTGILFGIVLYITSTIVGYFFRPRRNHNDEVPLVDRTSVYRNCSESPALMMSDFMPLYSIPLRENELD